MICLIQRVTQSTVSIGGEIVSEINQGLTVLVGFESGDLSLNQDQLNNLMKKMADRLIAYRVFSDEDGRMNLNVQQVNGGVLLVPQFTLAADTSKGLRPGFHTAAAPDRAEELFDRFVSLVSARYERVQQGQFGADMQVSLVNDGPVTFWLQL